MSVVVVVYNMAEEAKNTLYSLCCGYQRHIDAEDYEVIVVDNGSSEPLARDFIGSLPGRFSYEYLQRASPSPAHALNLGAAMASGEYLGFLIDGARIVTPGLLGYARRAFRAFDHPIVTSLAWHIGPAPHRQAIDRLGHSKEKEVRLLAGIDWKDHGYRLFTISSLAGSSADGWFLPKPESSTLFMRTDTFDALGGYDERFSEPGGGLVNFDLYARACERGETELVVLLGEGSFHQMHEGAMTGAPKELSKQRFKRWREQYRHLTGRDARAPDKKANFLGHVPREALEMLAYSASRAHARR